MMDSGRGAGMIGIDPPPQPSSSTAIAAELIMTAFAASLSAASPTSTSTSTSTPEPAAPSNPHDPEGECRLLGSFALLVQGALGGLALLALVYKRWRERPQRPLKIWFFDVSKQVFGSVLVHIANIFMSMLTSGGFSITATTAAAAAVVAESQGDARRNQPYVPNPCSFYLLNLAIDTTIGIPILIVLLRVITAIVSYTPLGKPRESIQSGHYGTPPSAWWWLKQSVIYFCGLFGMKICVLIIFVAMPWISKVGDWALSWTEGNEKLQIAFVMMIFPLIMNGLQYYIIDSFIKGQIKDEDVVVAAGDDDSDDDSGGSGGERGYQRGGPTRGRFTPVATDVHAGSDADDDDEQGEQERKRPAAVTVTRTRRVAAEEYDPDVDGDAPTVIGSSSSSQRKMAALSKS